MIFNNVNSRPEFSAIYNDQNGGDYATWYRIQVSTSSLGNWAHAKWDSGTTTMATTTQGSRSADISYAGSNLASSTTYYWRTRFSDDRQKTGAWSTATSTFSLAAGSGDGVTVYYIHTDHLSGSNAITNEAGELVQVLDYYPYGSIRVNSQEGNFNEKRKHMGYEYDDSTSLNYAGVRYQNPNQGRWISQDPASRGNPEKFLQNPQALNTYSYAENNPIIKRDPNGEFVPQAIVLGTLFGGIGNTAVQGYKDYQAGSFSGFGAYGKAFSEGAAVGFTTTINPFLGAGTVGALSLRESYRSNGGYITAEDAVNATTESLVTGFTGGFLKGLPQVSGPQAFRIFGGNYFTGAHGVRYAWEAAFGFGTDIYNRTIQGITQGFLNYYSSPKTNSTSGYSGGGGNINDLSQSVINYANTSGNDLNDPGFVAGIRAINEYNNNLGK